MKHRRFHPASVYRLLLRLYPAGFREEYEGPMEQQFRDDFRSAGNTRQRAMLWNAAVLDIVTQAPAQFACEVGRICVIQLPRVPEPFHNGRSCRWRAGDGGNRGKHGGIFSV